MKTKTCIVAILLTAGLISSRAQDTWIRKADFGGVAREGATGFSIGSKGYIGLGAEYPISYKDFWEYDPDANTWTQKADFGGDGRLYAVGFTIAGKGYVGTGQSGAFPNYTYYKDFWEYDPNSNTWTRKSDFGGTARYGAVGFSIDSKGYLGTGTDDSIINKKDFWEFDPIQNIWTQKADFAGGERKWATGLTIGAKGYVGTGGDIITYKDFWEYNPATDTWVQKADFGGSARIVPASFSIGNKGYIGTGENENTTTLKDFWQFDPTTNTWSQKVDFGGTGRDQAAGFSIGSKGYIGTGVGSSYKKDFWQYTPEETSIAIDIKPGTFPNSINPRAKGVIPVAILTTDTFDATAVDPTTVRFGPNGTEAAPVQSALEDVDGDGDTDMILHFKTQDTGIVCGDTSASLTGETFDGQAIEGSDSIKTVGCK
jgi:N-acetylneuraminic acid mutarotase